jgi:hypothetical protein
MAGKAGEKNVCNLSDQIRGSRYINFKTTTDGYKTAAGAMNASLAFPCALMFFCSEKTETLQPGIVYQNQAVRLLIDNYLNPN